MHKGNGGLAGSRPLDFLLINVAVLIRITGVSFCEACILLATWPPQGERGGGWGMGAFASHVLLLYFAYRVVFASAVACSRRKRILFPR